MKINRTKFDIAMANASYSMKKLSDTTGISHVSLINMKYGRVKTRPENIGKIAKALNVSVEYLVSEK